MRYNQLLGFKDVNGLSKPDIIFGPGNDEKVFAALATAADKHIFPAGYKRIALVGWDAPIQELAYISEEVAASSQKTFKAQLAVQEKARERERVNRDLQKNFTAASKIFQAASTKRNLAISKLSSAEALLATPTLPEKDRDAQIKAVEKARGESTGIADDFSKNILPHWQAITSVKSTPEQKQAAFIALGVIKAPEISAPEQAAANT
jgi:hypothetical protein